MMRQIGIYADTVLTGGKVLTLDDAFSVVEAVAIRDGRVLATGTDAEIEGLTGPGTRRVALEERTVLPGLIDAHCHVRATGVLLAQLRLYDCRSLDDILGRVEA